ncbi:MAG: peptide chain release factor N(5)-glutamine methyltransferase [Lachnospiraceae bacterium]|nr:peptide chain release factor N(5)-glutamine methyltransferase [Lachnospiraceae bacterium]
MTYRELCDKGALMLKAAEVPEYSLDARLLLQFVCDTDANYLFAHGDAPVDKEREARFLNLIKKRAARIPLQHLTGTQGFMGLEFKVSPAVLIPRPDTECLVEEALKELHDGMRILDMCTGSGCILLSLLKYSNDCEGVGSDISEEALKIASENAENLSVKAEFVRGDLFENVTGRFDLLVSNPPYIVTCEIEELMPEVRDHDPFIALNGHEDGLFFYQRIINECPGYLNRGAYVFFEIGCEQGAAVSGLLESAGFKDVEVLKDLAGLDRVVKGRKG